MPEQDPLEAIKELRNSMENPEVLDLELQSVLKRVAEQDTVFWTGGINFQGWTNIRDLTDFYVEDYAVVPDVNVFLEVLNGVGNPGQVISEFEFSVHNEQHELSFIFKNTPIVWDEREKKWIAQKDETP